MQLPLRKGQERPAFEHWVLQHRVLSIVWVPHEDRHCLQGSRDDLQKVLEHTL
jgi:hypothetical protein